MPNNDKPRFALWKRVLIADPLSGELYMDRLQIIRTPWFAVYLNHTRRSDLERDLHDHPADFISFILKGGYTEKNEKPGDIRLFDAPAVNMRWAEKPHRLTLIEPTWSLMFMGPRRREWGFHTPEGWVHHDAYTINPASREKC